LTDAAAAMEILRSGAHPGTGQGCRTTSVAMQATSMSVKANPLGGNRQVTIRRRRRLYSRPQPGPGWFCQRSSRHPLWRM